MVAHAQGRLGFAMSDALKARIARGGMTKACAIQPTKQPKRPVHVRFVRMPCCISGRLRLA